MKETDIKEKINTLRNLLEKEIPNDDTTREYEKCIARFSDSHRSEEEIKIFHTLMNEETDISYKAFFCLATIYRHSRNYSELRELIERAEADSRYNNRISLKHIRVMYETHSESLYDYDELLSLAHESACVLYDNSGYQHTFANAFATICENCLSEDLNSIMDEWYESALHCVNRAIKIEPGYAKYYSTKARIVALKNQFEESNRLLITAIDKEDSRKHDYALLIGNYQYYRTMISIKKHQWLLSKGRQFDESKQNNQSVLSSMFNETLNYVFISYSRSNSKKVLELIEELKNRGVNIWYDGCIPGGEEWDNEIGKKLLGSKTVFLFLSQQAIMSRNVRNEIRMAQNHKIPIIPVFLEEVLLSPGAELQLSGYQSYMYYAIGKESFLDKIMNDLNLARIYPKKEETAQKTETKAVETEPIGKIKIIEHFCEGKTGDQEKNEDLLVITNDFIAVIDGASSKTQAKFNGKTGGKLSAEFIGNYIRSDEFESVIDGKTAIVRLQTALQNYSDQMGFKNMGIHLCASVVIYSVARKQIWSVGDCQFILNKKLYTFSKKVDEIMSQTRALAIHMLISSGETEESLMKNDKARDLILDELAMQRYLENQGGEYGYSVFSDRGKIKDSFFINVPSGSEVILASDGYPHLYDTLEKSEKYLNDLVDKDPLCYKIFRSTKGLSKGNLSFDDRTYVRFKTMT